MAHPKGWVTAAVIDDRGAKHAAHLRAGKERMNKDNIVGRIGRFSVRLERDEDACNPCEEWDMAGTMICWHSRYNLGHCGGSRRKMKKGSQFFPDHDSFKEWWEENGKGGLILNLYLYDHSGITISCSPFSCPWDSGQVGYIFVTRETILKKWGSGRTRVTKKMLELADKCLRSEVETYDQYLRGDVWGYVIAEHTSDDPEAEVVNDHVDSLWGLYGSEYAKEEAMDALKAHVEHADKIPTLKAVGVA